ncbi:MAG: hypothetical protein ACKV2Q_15170 [Planctomycetaceae bacterium]
MLRSGAASAAILSAVTSSDLLAILDEVSHRAIIINHQQGWHIRASFLREGDQ